MRNGGVDLTVNGKIETGSPAPGIDGAPHSSLSSSGSALGFLGVVLYYCVLTIIMTWPLIIRMGREMVGQVGDNIYFVWMIAWIKKAVFDLGVNPFNVWFLNYPEGWSLAYTEITPAQLLLALPFSLFASPIFAYNMAHLLSFFLAGLGMYIWVRRLTANEPAALVAGTLYGFIPYHFAHFLIGHLNLSGIQWFPFYFMGFFEILENNQKMARKKTIRRLVILTGIALGLIALTSQYYLYMTIILSAFIFLWHSIFLEKNWPKRFDRMRQMLLMGLVALPLILLAIVPYVRLLGAGGLPDRNLGIVRLYSASPTDFILPSTDHFLWGRWIGDHFNREMWVEGTLYIGWVSILIGLVAYCKWRQIRNGHILALLLPGTLFAIFLAMGIDLHWNGEPVTLRIPAFLQGLLGRSESPIPLPGYFLFLYFPLYAKLRALMRFGIFALLFACTAAGLGTSWIIAKIGYRSRRAVMAMLLLLVFLDFYPGPYKDFFSVQPRPVDAWLARQPGNGAVIQFPFIMSEDQEQTYYTLFHGKPFVGGFFNAFPPAQYSRLLPIMEKFPDTASISQLEELGVEFVLVDKDEYPDLEAVRQACEKQGLRFIETMGDQMVFTREGKGKVE